MNKSSFFLLIPFLVSLIACTSNSSEDKTIYVAAASDLYHALTEIGEEFTNDTGIQLEYTYGSTGLLTQQILEGAPFDLFLSAHESYINRLVERDVIFDDSTAYYAVGRIAIMSRMDRTLDKEYFLDPEVNVITIANPEHAPYGKAAKETLETWGIWEEVEPKIVYAENIRQAYQYVESGNADLGIIALSLMNHTNFHYEVIEEGTHEPLLQALGIPKQAGNKALSQEFSNYILSEKGQSILLKYGFDILK
ncbi:molybdate ABC transporter substrate-binding protein [Evansella tamaricis]|uniref:Molybdate ABC transporter substrate-binding protein n=1 Tax=Evansella tamaricis TaxID=2069301 RepID=A0ABS6JIL1_9BACI|nr:molybdate ABC transporter substrate-binding protein [Evansella tamaricis]MBU9713481.1 molybdate ABC transporter substrate-binding protein [Evansella tamaricis]